jgi:hypothetical protein
MNCDEIPVWQNTDSFWVFASTELFEFFPGYDIRDYGSVTARGEFADWNHVACLSGAVPSPKSQ